MPKISPAKLHRAQASGEYMVVDLRTFAAFNQAHITGTLHIPFEELSDRVGELDGNKIVVLYELSPNEPTTPSAAMYLYELGFTRVFVLDGGLQRWYSEGYPIEGTLLTPTPGFAGQPGTVTPLPTSTPLPTMTRTPTGTPIRVTGTVTPTITPSR